MATYAFSDLHGDYQLWTAIKNYCKDDDILFNLATGQAEDESEEDKLFELESRFIRKVLNKADRYEDVDSGNFVSEIYFADTYPVFPSKSILYQFPVWPIIFTLSFFDKLSISSLSVVGSFLTLSPSALTYPVLFNSVVVSSGFVVGSSVVDSSAVWFVVCSGSFGCSCVGVSTFVSEFFKIFFLSHTW